MTKIFLQAQTQHQILGTPTTSKSRGLDVAERAGMDMEVCEASQLIRSLIHHSELG